MFLARFDRSTMVSSKIEKVFYNISMTAGFRLYKKRRKDMLPKPALLLLSFVLIFLGCVTTTKNTSKPKRPRIKKSIYIPPSEPPIIFYEQYNSWKSPFNPHKVLREWTKLSFNVEESIYFITVGNPKHNWSSWSKSKDPLNRNIPEGEVTSAVIFVFSIAKSKEIELEGFEFVDNLGIRNLFIWDKKVKCYVRFPDISQQRSI